VFSVFPNLIGFVLAGYAIVVGFGNKDFLKMTSEPENGKMSFYQTYSYIYAFSLIILIVTLITAVLFKFLSVICCSVGTVYFVQCMNHIGLFILIFLISLSLISLLFMVINVFNLAQMHHFALSLERMAEKREESSEQENLN
jgi:energy-coupling factor transporter transmembrane protein EcfT